MNSDLYGHIPTLENGSPLRLKAGANFASPFLIASDTARTGTPLFPSRRAPEPKPKPSANGEVNGHTNGEPGPRDSPFFAFQQPAEEHAPFILDEVNSSPNQAALRAIFGVDHEMTVEEILQRLRALPGIRHIAQVTPDDVAAVDGLKKSLSELGFGTANIRIYGGNQPMEFIRHANTLLAVQTINGFGPGVKEAIKIATQEIQRLS